MHGHKSPAERRRGRAVALGARGTGETAEGCPGEPTREVAELRDEHGGSGQGAARATPPLGLADQHGLLQVGDFLVVLLLDTRSVSVHRKRLCPACVDGRAARLGQELMAPEGWSGRHRTPQRRTPASPRPSAFPTDSHGQGQGGSKWQPLGTVLCTPFSDLWIYRQWPVYPGSSPQRDPLKLWCQSDSQLVGVVPL